MIELAVFEDMGAVERRWKATEGRSTLLVFGSDEVEVAHRGQSVRVSGPAVIHRSPALGLAVRSWPPGPLWLLQFDGPDADRLIDLAFQLLCPMTGMLALPLSAPQFATVRTLLGLMEDRQVPRDLKRTQTELLLRYLGQFEGESPARRLADGDLVRRYVATVDKWHGEEHQVTAYADRLGVSVRTLNRVFRESTGITPKASLQYRLNLAAKRHLQDGTATVKEVSYRLGFRSPAYFQSFFRRHNGLSPGQYARVNSEYRP